MQLALLHPRSDLVGQLVCKVGERTKVSAKMVSKLRIIIMPRPRKKPLRDSGRHRRQVSRLLQGREVLHVFKFYSPFNI